MIDFKHVHKSFKGGVVALSGVSFTVNHGELLALIGPSGCGKTTLLKLVNRLLEPDSGRVEVDNHCVSQLDPIALRRSIGYVLQHFGLFPHLTVAENIATVPGLLGWDKATTQARVTELLQLVGLEARGFGERFPDRLSGGQQQRVGLARALAAEPRILLMDEPFGALDPLTRDELQLEYKNLHTTLGLTAIFVTHDINEALLMADRVAIMSAGQLIQLDTPARLLTHPANDTVQRMLATPKRQLARLAAIADASHDR